MYSKDVVAARIREMEQQYRPDPAFREYTPQEVEEWLKRLSDIRDAKGRPKRDPTKEEWTFIWNEIIMCKASFLYWCERYGVINSRGAGLIKMRPLREGQRLVLDRIAEIEFKTFYGETSDGTLVNILKARQVGVSTLSEAMLAHRAATQTNLFGLMASDTPEASAYLSTIFSRFIDHLPPFLSPQKTIWQQSFPQEFAFNTGCHVWSAAGKSTRGTEGRRGQIGRGKTVSICHLSELSTWDSPEQIDDALLPTMPIAESTLALFESTAKGRHNWWHEHWIISKKGEGRFHPVFIPWYAHEEYRLKPPLGWIPSQQSVDHAERCRSGSPQWIGHEVTLEQDQIYWYERNRTYHESKGTLAKFLEEYPADDSEAFQHSGQSIFGVETLERIQSQMRPTAAILEIQPVRNIK